MMANEMRDRLVELIKQVDSYCTGAECCYNCVGYGKGADCFNYLIADHLIENGVVVPQFRCGDRVWFIPKGLNEICDATVVRVEYNYFTSPQEWIVLDYFSSIVGKQEYKSRIDLMLGKTVFFIKEAAEQKLKEMRGVQE